MRSLRTQSRKCFPDGEVNEKKKKKERIHQKMKAIFLFHYTVFNFSLEKEDICTEPPKKNGECIAENS